MIERCTVAPHVGAWIETFRIGQRQGMKYVAPHVGAWIETARNLETSPLPLVAPHVGAWIETTVLILNIGGKSGRTSRRCVD